MEGQRRQRRKLYQDVRVAIRTFDGVDKDKLPKKVLEIVRDALHAFDDVVADLMNELLYYDNNNIDMVVPEGQDPRRPKHMGLHQYFLQLQQPQQQGHHGLRGPLQKACQSQADYGPVR